jgi:hypothetical protein
MGNKVAAMVGFLILGISPSFVDWEQAPDKRWQILGYYGIALALIYFGLFGGRK